MKCCKGLRKHFSPARIQTNCNFRPVELVMLNAMFNGSVYRVTHETVKRQGKYKDMSVISVSSERAHFLRRLASFVSSASSLSSTVDIGVLRRIEPRAAVADLVGDGVREASRDDARVGERKVLL